MTTASNCQAALRVCRLFSSINGLNQLSAARHAANVTQLSHPENNASPFPLRSQELIAETSTVGYSNPVVVIHRAFR
jgi:hypothetical protein